MMQRPGQPAGLEIADVVTLVAEVDACRLIYNNVRPHDSLDDVPPISRYLSEPLEPHLSEARTVQES